MKAKAVLTVRVRPALKEQLFRTAKDERRTPSNLTEILLDEAFAAREPKGDGEAKINAGRTL